MEVEVPCIVVRRWCVRRGVYRSVPVAWPRGEGRPWASARAAVHFEQSLFRWDSMVSSLKDYEV